MNTDKVDFLTKVFPDFLSTLKAGEKGKWGVMNAQQMVEHMSYSIRIANGKIPKKILTPADRLEKAKSFMMSDKPFRENTKNIELPDEPLPVIHPDMKTSIDEMKDELLVFFQTFDGNEKKTITDPFFGELNFMEWVQLLYKHAMHHAKQFGFAR